MSAKTSNGQCTACEATGPTFLYHGKDLKKIELCVECYDAYLAKEMTQYWKDHIQEEKRRTGKASRSQDAM